MYTKVYRNGGIHFAYILYTFCTYTSIVAIHLVQFLYTKCKHDFHPGDHLQKTEVTLKS